MEKLKKSFMREAKGVKREGFNKENKPARSAHNSLVTSYSLLVTRKQAKLAFTMAEILLSLTIIGVVAAITLPSLTGNINERTWNTQRKALYSRMSQAISLMPALNGYGTLDDTTDTAAETFITAGLSKVLKINNICDNSHLEDCGIVPEFTNMAATKMSTPTTLYSLDNKFSLTQYTDGEGINNSYSAPNTNAAAFETQNGESIVTYYNRNCRTEYLNQENVGRHGHTFGFPQKTMCLNFIYDLNGKKGPNTFGKDIGVMTVFNATDSVVVAPIPASTSNVGSFRWDAAGKACTDQDPETRLPNIEELSAMTINRNILNFATDGGFWSSSVSSTEKAWFVNANIGIRHTYPKTSNGAVRCVKR